MGILNQNSDTLLADRGRNKRLMYDMKAE